MGGIGILPVVHPDEEQNALFADTARRVYGLAL
jgi:hypothetical protein